MELPVFLKSRFTIDPGMGMGSFSVGHMLWLGLLLVLILVLGKRYKAASAETRKRMRLIVAVLIILDEAVKDAAMSLTGQWDWSFLPLHLCSVSVFAVFIHALTGNRYLEEYIYAVTLPTALMAMVFPDWVGKLPFLSLMCIHSFSIHMLLVIYPVLLLYGGFRPSWHRLLRIIPFIVLFGSVIYFVNLLLGTDFFFLNGAGTGNPLSILEKYIGGWYRLAFPLIAFVCWLPMYLIPYRRNKASF